MKKPTKTAMIISLFCSILISCAKTHKDNDDIQRHQDTQRASLEPDLISSLNLSTSSFMDIPVERRFDGIREFFQSYASKYMTNVSVAKSECNDSVRSSGFLHYCWIELKKEDIVMKLFVFIQGSNNLVSHATLSNYASDNTKTSLDIYAKEIFDSKLCNKEALINLNSNFISWVKTKPTSHTIFAMEYAEFISAILDKSGKDNQKNKLNDDCIVNLIPSSESMMSGKVRFIFVSEYLLAKGFLDCNSISCLNDDSVDYYIQEGALAFHRKKPSLDNEPGRTIFSYQISLADVGKILLGL